ncbi:hypothetical protein HG537_0D05290 [Torulaspora globosa]|uniref:Cytochrome b-c1 complex subunit 6, mitochondrial n=1 Tax=Torulaspora globosa TaxID=48254 RepID=A0A7H9HS11_9SACH|nr:hypothetical protein HG537_0D05290 [Torulaspora sp. CBS 2947]
MITAITEFLEEIKDSFVPTVAKAEDDVEENEEEDDEEDDEDEDEDEEEEAADQLDELREECKQTPEGKEAVHHYMECAERVQKQQQQPGYDDLEYKEDCVEEFFHLQHYLDGCAAPRLFNKLK